MLLVGSLGDEGLGEHALVETERSGHIWSWRIVSERSKRTSERKP